MSTRKKTTMTKVKKPEAPTPRSDAEAEGWLHQLGLRQRMLDDIERRMNAELAEVKLKFANLASPFAGEAAQITKGLAKYCRQHRKRLTDGFKSKTVAFATGTAEWRAKPASVRIDGGEEAVLAAIEAQSLDLFIRLKKTINREAMLENPDLALTLPGVTIGSTGESFTLTPFGAELNTGLTAVPTEPSAKAA